MLDFAALMRDVSIVRHEAAALPKFGWGTPVLYLRARNAVRLPEQAADASLVAARDGARISVSQVIATLRGQATALQIDTMSGGVASVEQKIEILERGAEATAVKVGTMTAGTLDVQTTGTTVDGVMTGTVITSLGAPPPKNSAG